MSEPIAFLQNGSTANITAAQTPPTPIQITSNFSATGNILPRLQYRILNTGSVVVFLGVGHTAAEATANSAVVSTVGNGIPLLPGTDEVFSFPGDSYFTASIGSATTAAVYITPGEGL
jgi:hypothetical protein